VPHRAACAVDRAGAPAIEPRAQIALLDEIEGLVRGTSLAVLVTDMFLVRRPIHRVASLVSCSVAVLAIASTATADPEEHASVVRPRPPSREPPPLPTPAEPEHTAADVASAPVPGDESGRSDGVDPGDSTARQIGRGLLFFPKLAVDAALFPIRGLVWFEDRYRPDDWYRRVFFNDAMTIGLYPTFVIDTSLGVTVGARFVHKDLLGQHEQLQLQAAASSRFQQIYSAGFRSGDRFGERFHLDYDAGYERRPHDAFYGIGNGDRMPVGAQIDPRVDATSVEARFRQDRTRFAMVADLRVFSHLHLRGSGAAAQVQFAAGDEGNAIDQVYSPMGLVGFGGVEYGYGELELRWDGRHAAAFEPGAVYSGGSLVDVFGGRLHRLDPGPDFWRYGGDVQHFVRLGDAPRVIVARFHGEGVTGGRDEVPFTELPRLGGSTYLRGYDLDRFRDRVAAFGTLAYSWDVSQWVSGNLFVDVGRVYPGLDQLSLDHLRAGYGIGLEIHGNHDFLLEGSIASSIDGGLFLNLAFNPVYDLDERVRRR
jgi:hypothetical protein